MKAVVQRVRDASVSVNGKRVGQIGCGLLVYLGVAHDDTATDADWMAEKIINLRIFDDDDGKMNRSLLDVVNHNNLQVNKMVNHDKNEVNGTVGVLAISQFTLLGDARKGRRPSWGKAAPPEQARKLYDYFIEQVRQGGLPCECGEFQAVMQVTYTNDGPVTILLDTAEVRTTGAI